MSTETTERGEDNYIDIIDIENLTPSGLDDTNSIEELEEHTKNAFDRLLNKDESDLSNL